ncbi:sugar isomerase domain-containing protein [Bacillus kexueae]|uniref:sugar isomerase domain-containing protein n=1 Tax=Aeribacillus kexueae TaxID=2078952 RepID=UPI001FB02C0F|nr:SIS domain-containing protein [Bacillus kexueae]
MKYFQEIHKLLQTVEENEQASIQTAAEKLANCLVNDGIIHVFGCGHSHIIGEELFYRAGGLAPINPIFYEDLMLHKGAERSSTLERTSGLAEDILTNVTIEPHDVFFITSASGRNPAPIQVAELAKKRGAYTIGLTSTTYAKAQASRHPKGMYLHEVVDHVIDTHIPVGDGLMKHDPLNIQYAPASTVIGTAIVGSIISETISLLAKNGHTPPVFQSGNLDGADEHNRKLIERYRNRIPHF